MSEVTLHFNGINGLTGAPLTAAKTEEEWLDWILSEDLKEPEEQKNALRTIWEKLRKRVMGTIAGVNAQDLEQAGWGIIYPEGTPDEVKTELAELVAERKGKELTYKQGTTFQQFRTEHGQGPGVVNPENLPYYLLIVGSPAEVPFRFQYGLDIEHAVGRIYFEDVKDYGRYAKRVLKYEGGSGSLPRERRVAFFSTSNRDDEATARSDEYLAEPLASKLEGKALRTIDGKEIGGTEWGENRVPTPDGKPLVYRAEHVRGDAAKKVALLDLLTRESQPPALLFTATHGLGFPGKPELQKTDQGGLVCAEWPGPLQHPENTMLEDGMYLAGHHLDPDARFDDLIVFAFACYSAGTPHLADFDHFDYYKPKELASQAFVARLPQRMLAQGALAFFGHVDRAWDYSFLWDKVEDHTDSFRSTLEAILTGVRVGHAFEYFNRRYQDLNAYLIGSQEDSLINQYYGGYGDPPEMARIWTARNDARAYVLYGDPAVRLRWKDMPAA
jgi:hypothetical protein